MRTQSRKLGNKIRLTLSVLFIIGIVEIIKAMNVTFEKKDDLNDIDIMAYSGKLSD